MRKGKGITGVGTAFTNPQISGRLTLYQLYKMQDERVKDQAFSFVKNEEFDKVRDLLRMKEKLNAR